MTSSHINKRVDENFSEWVEKTHVSKENGHIRITRGNDDDYLVMTLDYSEKQKLKVDMRDYINGILEEFPYDIKAQQKAPWNKKLLKVNDNDKRKNRNSDLTFRN